MMAENYPMTFSNEQQVQMNNTNVEMLPIQTMNSTTGPKNLRRYFSAKGDINMENGNENHKFDNL